MRPIQPVTLTAFDGQEFRFLLSMGGIRRLKERFGVKVINEILQYDAEGCGVPILYEALLDKNGMTEDEFAEKLPANLELIIQTVLKLLGVSLPQPRPTDAETTQIQ